MKKSTFIMANHGFSLLEMLCVCAMVAFLSLLTFPAYQHTIAQCYTKQALAKLLHKENTWLQQSLQTGESLNEIAHQESWPQRMVNGRYELNMSEGEDEHPILSMKALGNQQQFDPCSPWKIDQNFNIHSSCSS